MPTVGSTLSAERIRQGLSVQDIARVTKLNPRAIEAIEADSFEQLPGLVFARNFVRQYAEVLHLNATAISRQFEREQSLPLPEFSPAEISSPVFVPRINQSALTGIFASDAISAFTTFVLTLAVCGAAFYGFQYWRTHKAATRTAKVETRVQSQPQPPPKPEAVTTPVSSLTTTSAPVTTAANVSNVHVDLTASGPCWTRITADGRVLFTGTLAAGDTRRIDAESAVIIRAGNAGALALRLNGTDVPALGPSGQIRSVTLTRAGAQVRAPSPELLSDF